MFSTSPGAIGEPAVKEDGVVIRSAEYVGSFPVDDSCLDDQIEQLHQNLKTLKACKKKRPVLLKFSVKGVKMYNEDETTLLMAHALRRVSLSTARPSVAQFAFVSHNPGRTDAQLYCHVFRARHARAAQFLNLLLCRCFQLSYLEKHPEEAQEVSSGSAPRRNPSLLNHGFPLSVSALVSFRRAPFRGLIFGSKKNDTPFEEQRIGSGQDEVFSSSSPSLVRKKAIRNKELRSGAYRSFTFTPLKQRHVQERLGASQGGPAVQKALSRFRDLIRILCHKVEKEHEKTTARRSRAPSLAETEEALAQAVWCWDGIATDSSYSLLADDVLGSYLLCPHPKKPKSGSLIIRFPTGPVTLLIENTRKGNFLLEKTKAEFSSLAELIEHFTESQDGLPCRLSCARVNHCYEWEEEDATAPQERRKSPTKSRMQRIVKGIGVKFGH